MVPTCPVHQSPMKPGRGGGFFCTRKDANGQWCSQKVSASQAGAPPAQSPAPQAAPTTPAHLLLIAALDFAAKVYQGTANDEGATNLANQVYAGWRGEL